MKGISNRQKRAVKANVNRQKFDLAKKKLEEEEQKMKKSSTVKRKSL